MELVTCMEQQLINILMRTYNISPSDAFEIWSKARTAKDPRICEILDALIKNGKGNPGIPVIINRNPSIGNPERYPYNYTNKYIIRSKNIFLEKCNI